MLRRYTWQGQKEKLQHYRRRQPESSVLYRVVHHSRDDLVYQWESRFQHQYGALRDEVTKTFDEYLTCGILKHGAARVYCDGCKHSLLVAFSCKRRGVCPSCGAKRAVKFAEQLYDEVIEEVPHRHIVFTIPKRLRVYFKYDRSLLSLLFKAARGALAEILGIEERELGAILTVQTAGEGLNWHPHLHGLIADGYWEGEQFTTFPTIDMKSITHAFAKRVLTLLQKQELISDDVATQILSQEHSGFSVWLGEPFKDKESEHFVARYIERAPLSLEKLSIQDDIVTYTSKDGAVQDFDALEFLATLSSHIPKTYESVTRYYGRYSSRRRGERAKRAASVRGGEAAIKEQNGDAPGKATKSSWAACIRRVYEIDPLACPKCNGRMRIIAFIQDPHAIANIMKAQGLPYFTAPPPIPKFIDTAMAVDELPPYDLADQLPDEF